MERNKVIELLKRSKPTDSFSIVSLSIKLFFDDFKFYLGKIFLFQLMLSILWLLYIHYSDFEFSYDYLSSSGGIITFVGILLTIAINRTYLKLKIGTKYYIKREEIKISKEIILILQLLLKSIFELLASILSTVILVFAFILPGMINFIYPFIDIYFKFYWVKRFENLNSSLKISELLKFIHGFKLYIFKTVLIWRFLVISVSVILFVSLFVIYEFYRIIFGGELFIFFEDRLRALLIFALLPYFTFLIFNSITYLCYVVMYDYILLKKEGFYIIEKINKND